MKAAKWMVGVSMKQVTLVKLCCVLWGKKAEKDAHFYKK